MTLTASKCERRGTLQIRPITGNLGAEVSGADLSRPLSENLIAEIRSALDRYLVLFSHDQNLSPLQLRTFVGRFGPLFLHPEVRGLTEAPEVLELRNEPGDGKLFGGSDWHSDVSWQSPGGYVSALHAIEVPTVGGDTCFASLIQAFESLSAGMKAMLRSVRAVHTYNSSRGGERTAIHPVVRRHPVTEREGLYLNAMFVRHFEGMTPEESRPLLDYLTARAIRHEFTCRFRWRNGSLAIWDNRFTLHLPIKDFTDERRVMIRATALETPV